MILQVLFLVLLLVPSGLVAAYYLVWAVARVAGLQDTKRPAPPARHRIRIVIPAHDEQETLPATLDSCARLDYPRELYAVTVVADNCHDATAQVARQRGVDCIERSDPARPGKGFALGWALDQLRAAPHDALLVLDADCTLDSQALQVLDAFLQDGARVLQANHRVVNADASPISYAAAVGRRLEYDLFFSPKSRCGLAVLLVGTGMLLHRCVLEQDPWSSHSCTEDTEYTLQLARRGLPVRFAANAWVECRGAETVEQLRIQRSRWARGNLALGKSQAARLVRAGWRQRNLLMFDLGVSLLVLSRPLVLLHLATTVLLGTMLPWLVPGTLSAYLARTSLLVLLGYAVYLALGIASLGLNGTRLRHLLRAPWVVVRLATISLAALVRPRQAPWTRTPRS